MKLAVLADIHGNLTALEAVIADIEQRDVDQVVHGGDLVLIGARPAEVLDRIWELGWPGIVGNTDELLWRPEGFDDQLRAAPKLEPLLRMLFQQYRPATVERLGEERVSRMRDLPAQFVLGGLSLVHATPGNLWRAPMPDASDADLQNSYESLRARTVIYGHIHRGFVRNVPSGVIANTGSVGLPWDGDPRASYLVVEDGRAQVVRVEYDV